MHAYTFSFVLLSKILSCESYHRSRKLDNQNGTLSGRTIAKCLFLPEMGLNDRYRLLERSRSRCRHMHEHTGKLPLIDDAGETPEIGFSTETAMRAGAVLGVAYEIEGYIARLNKVYPDLFVFLTGGDALKLAAKIKSRIFVDENLVLTGLNRILQENAKI